VQDPIQDTLGRPLRDLRISVTDRCNFRCSYCMPKEVFGRGYVYLPRPELLHYGEVGAVVEALLPLGLKKIRLTGGEPLLRRDLWRLVERLAALPGIEDVALTTNGGFLAARAEELAHAGLGRVTVSLDALDDAVFRKINDVDFPVTRVLEGIDAALAAGLRPVKVNAVVKRGVNEDEVLPMAHHFRGSPVVLRFIEYMDVGTSNGWRLDDVVPSAHLVERIGAEFPIEPIEAQYPGEVAKRWRYVDGGGEIGFVSSVTHPFCGACNRARLSADGQLYTCLFGTKGHDLKTLLRGGASAEEMRAAVASIWQSRADRYSERRSAETASDGRVEMSYIGG
jgi:cyclic pyranopterin phosphate synthase